MHIFLDHVLRNEIFPANILIDKSGQILSKGPVVKRLYPNIAPSQNVSDHFYILASDQSIPIDKLNEIRGLVRLEPKGPGTSLSGWLIGTQDGYFLALRVSPNTYMLDGTSLEISDFAPGDPFVHGLMMFTMQRALIEEQKTATIELSKARQISEDLLERFSRISGFMAHDFNNFLSIIRLNCERLEIDLTRNRNFKLLRFVDIIKATATRGSTITRSLMSLAHQQQDEVQPVSIDSLITENEGLLLSIMGAKVKVDIDLQAAPWHVNVNPSAALNTLVNLLINSRDAMPHGGILELRTLHERRTTERQAGEYPMTRDLIVVTIRDSGAGMPDHVLRRAFDPLFSTKPRGNGLGLASVRDFAVEAGGDVRIESTEGVGTCVTIELPAHSRPEAHVSNTISTLRNVESGTACSRVKDTILVVDDEPDALEALCELIEHHGFDVIGCSTIDEALSAMAHTPAKILLTDIILSNESGADLARQVSYLYPSTRIMLMSGYVPNEETIIPEWQFFQKPINSRSMIQCINDTFAELN